MPLKDCVQMKNHLRSMRTLATSLIVFISILVAGNCFAAKLSGQLMMTDGSPLSGGLVGIFDQKSGPPPQPELFLRIPDYHGDLDENGKFQVKVPAGSYYIGGIVDQPGKNGDAPPEKGDTLLLVKDQDGKLKLFTVTEKQSLDIGTISSGTIFDPPDEVADNAAIGGTISDGQNNPIKGIVIIATDNKHNPDDATRFTSKPSANDGTFQIGLPGKGTYRLKLWSTSRQEPVVQFSLTSDTPQVKIKNGYLIVTIKENRPIKGVGIQIH